MNKTTLTTRTPDSMVRVTVEVHPLAVAYADILEAVQTLPDDLFTAPWDDCDGWQHELVSAPDEAERSAMHGVIRHNRDYRGKVIQLSAKAGLPDAAYYRSKGASRGVAKQLEAQALREATDTLLGWYNDGWSYFGVNCDFRYAGENYHASVWGIIETESAREEFRHQIAGEIVHKLERAGFTVTGQPARSALKYGWSALDWRKHYRTNLNGQNMSRR